MKQLIVILLLSVSAMANAAADDALTARAARAYSSGDWASAQALYGQVYSRRPDDFRAMARALSAGLMRGDTASAVPLVEHALTAGVPLDSLINSFEDDTRALGRADIYVATLHRLVDGIPYLRRPFNSRLLAYYRFRQDAGRIIEYSKLLLAGLPDNPRYLNSLAWGYALKGDMPQAIETWQQAIKADPDNFEALSAAGNALITTNPELSRSYIERAYALRPTPYLRNLLETLSNSNK